MSKDSSQKDRSPEALRPDYFQVDDRKIEALYLEARKLAEALIFYESSEEKNTSNWNDFFGEADHFMRKIDSGEWKNDLLQQEPGTCPPHLALFLAFLKLFGYTQQQLNQLPSAHLQFFYQKILLQERRGIMPDKAYVFFELARNIQNYLLPAQTALLAGKTSQGKSIIYHTDKDIFLHNAKITQLKAIHHRNTSDSSIYAFPEVKSMAINRNEQGWYPFGNTSTPGPTAEIGLGISSPMLFLQEGFREIYVSFTLGGTIPGEHHSIKPDEFEAQITTKEGWFPLEIKNAELPDGKLNFKMHLKDTDPPVSTFDKIIHGYPIGTGNIPLLKITLKTGFAFKRYVFFQSLQIIGIKIKVAVEKASSPLIRNDYGDLEAGKPFHPFGFNPIIGANLYLGLNEVFYKPVKSYNIKLSWKGLPEDFKTYYEGYQGQVNSLVRSNEDFKIKAAIKYQGKWVDIRNNTENTKEFPLFNKDLKLEAEEGFGKKHSSNTESNREDGVIRLTLSSPPQAFGHKIYPTIYAKAIMAQLQDKPSPIPHEPYTPVIDLVEMSYVAEEEIAFRNFGQTSFSYFHIGPFGISEKVNAGKNPASQGRVSFLSGEFRHAGSLYLGVDNFHPPQQLALFFKLAEENMQQKPDLLIHYLTKAGWRPIPENQVLSDSTMGLKQTGIISINIPEDASSENPQMPLHYHWIRISVPENPENFDRVLDIRTNAVTCTLNYEVSLPDLKVNTLPPGSIKKLLKNIVEIKQITQPYSSFGGRAAESEVEFFTRVSERLRHKTRGITGWDFERLILNKFPEIYKAKCIPHKNANGMLAPGHVHVIIIPIIKQYEWARILKPMVPASTLAEIREFIAGKASPHASIEVTHPQYEELKINAVVNFNSQVDAGFYLKKLNDDLQHFLSPWAFREDADIILGKKLYRSSIIEFIESREYVNFIASIKLLRNNKEIQDHEISPGERTIIVSADKHDIRSVSADRVVCQTNQGIEQMIIDINFEIQ